MIKKEDIPTLYTTEEIIKTIPTSEYKKKYVDLNVTMAACRQCPNYSKNWACPEFKEDVLKYWDEYDNLELTLTKIIFKKEVLDKPYSQEELMLIVDNSLFRQRNKMISQMEEKERRLNGKLLSAGYCGECDRCSRLDNEECRYPDKCHNSIESIGGLVGDTLSGVFGEEIKWIEDSKLPENLSLLMGLLY